MSRDRVRGILLPHRGVSYAASGGADGDGGERRVGVALVCVFRSLPYGLPLRGDFLHGGDDESDVGVRHHLLLCVYVRHSGQGAAYVGLHTAHIAVRRFDLFPRFCTLLAFRRVSGTFPSEFAAARHYLRLRGCGAAAFVGA